MQILGPEVGDLYIRLLDQILGYASPQSTLWICPWAMIFWQQFGGGAGSWYSPNLVHNLYQFPPVRHEVHHALFLYLPTRGPSEAGDPPNNQ